MIYDKSISVIIPAYNEEDIIGETLETLNRDWVDEIIVVNDGSSDKTKELVSKYPVKLINLEKNNGKGNAVSHGLKKSTGDILVIVDADLGNSVHEIKKLIYPLLNNRVEFTVGVLPIKGGGLGLVRKLAEIGMKYMTGKTMKAPLSGQRAFKREIMERLLPLQTGFALEMGLNISIIKQNIKFAEIECNFKHRITGHNFSGYRHRLNQFIDIIKSLIQLKWRKNV